MIALHAWPGGLAIVVEARARHAAAVFGPDGWRRGEPRAILPDGPPAGAESVSFHLPPWLADQLAALEIGLGGVHTDFVRLDRLIARMQAEGQDGAVVVMGRQPVAVLLSAGTPHIVEPAVPPGAPVMPVLASASGWVIVFSGKVVLPAPPAPTHAIVRPTATPAPGAEAVPAQAAASQVAPHPVPSPADERYVVVSSIAQAVPGDVAEEIRAAAGEPALAVVAQLDGAHAVADIAQSTGLTVEQVAAVVRLLSARKLAFKYVSRVRPPTGARTSG